MRAKKVIVLSVLSLVAILLLSTLTIACGGEEEEATPTPTPTVEVTAEEIRDRTIAAYDELETYELDMDMVMEMRISAMGQSARVTMTMDCEGAADEVNRQMRLDMEMDMAMTGEAPQHMRTEMYIVDDYVYMNIVAPGEPPGWVKFALPEGYWEEMDILQQQVNILVDVEADLVGTEIVDGTECYVLDVEPNLEELWAMLELGGAVEGLPPGLDFEQLITDFSLTQWVAKDTFFSPKGSASIEMVLTPESLGIPPEMAEDFDAVVDIEMTILQRNINEPVTIELPPGAEEAEEVPVP